MALQNWILERSDGNWQVGQLKDKKHSFLKMGSRIPVKFGPFPKFSFACELRRYAQLSLQKKK